LSFGLCYGGQFTTAKNGALQPFTVAQLIWWALCATKRSWRAGATDTIQNKGFGNKLA